MNKVLIGFLLFVTAFLIPQQLKAATCFWVGGTATWDNTNTGGGGAGGIKWASTSGGGTACGGAGTGGSPDATDSATFDASSGGGTVTVASTINGTNGLDTLTLPAFTGTLDFSVNNPNMNLSGALNNDGSGARTFKMGSGTWTFTGSGDVIRLNNQTNCTSCVYTANFVFSGNYNLRTFTSPSSGGLTFGTVTINNSTTAGTFNLAGTNTFSSLTVGTGIILTSPIFQTTTISGALSITGSSTLLSGIVINGVASSTNTTWSIGSSSTATWCVFLGVGRSGAGSLTATNSYNLGRSTGITITNPSFGGGGKIIGG